MRHSVFDFILDLKNIQTENKKLLYSNIKFDLNFAQFFMNVLLIFTFFYISSTYTRFKSKITITRCAKCFVPGISTCKNLLKEIESVYSNAPGRSSIFEQMLVG